MRPVLAFLAAARDRLRPGGDLLLIDVVRPTASHATIIWTSTTTMSTRVAGVDRPAGRIITHVRRNDWPEEVSTFPQWATAAGF